MVDINCDQAAHMIQDVLRRLPQHHRGPVLELVAVQVSRDGELIVEPDAWLQLHCRDGEDSGRGVCGECPHATAAAAERARSGGG